MNKKVKVIDHPSQDVMYCLSYPRSGSNWFRYCFAFIIETDIEAEYPLYHSHTCDNGLWTLENNFDVKSILLLRNYKEAIFSELKSAYMGEPSSIIWRVWEYLEKALPVDEKPELVLDSGARYAFESNGVYFYPAPRGGTRPVLSSMETSWVSHPQFQKLYTELRAEQQLKEFLLSGYPTIETAPAGEKEGALETILSGTFLHHFHFSYQLKRYYELLEYHDNVSKANPNKALLVKYEDFIRDPFSELGRVIDFMGENALASSAQTDRFRNNLDKIIDNIEHHKDASINRYKALGHSATSYGREFTHSEECTKEFLMQVDSVLKNKNSDLFNKYLLDYEEAVE